MTRLSQPTSQLARLGSSQGARDNAVSVGGYPGSMNKLLGVFLLVTLTTTTMAQHYGGWALNRNTDPITDENRSFIYAQATDFPGYASTSALVVRCSSDAYYPHGVSVYFVTDKYLGSEDYYRVVYRIDKREPVTERWSSSTDNEAVFLPVGEAPAFLAALTTGSEFVFRVTAFDEDYTYTLPIAGFNDALYALGCYTGPAL